MRVSAHVIKATGKAVLTTPSASICAICRRETTIGFFNRRVMNQAPSTPNAMRYITTESGPSSRSAILIHRNDVPQASTPRNTNAAHSRLRLIPAS